MSENSSIDTSRRGFLSRFSAKNNPVRAWQRDASFNNVDDNVFWCLLGETADDFLVAGDDGLVFHYYKENGQRENGAREEIEQGQWQQEDSQTKCPIHAMCQVSPDRIIAIGWFGIITERVNGQWRRIQGGCKSTSFDDKENQPLFALTVDSKGTAWASGDNGRICYQEGNQPWQEVEAGCETNYRSILALTDDSIMVGGNYGIVLHYSENEWQHIDIDSQCHIVDLCQVKEERIYAVGSEYNVKAGGFVGYVFYRENEQWHKLDTGHVLPRLRKIKHTEFGLWLIGDAGNIFLWQDNSLVKFSSGVNFDLHDMLIPKFELPIFCGDGSTVLLHKSEEEMNAQESVGLNALPQWQMQAKDLTNYILRAVWAHDDDNIFAVGEEGTIVHFNGTTWQLMACPIKVRLHDVWGSSPNNVFVAADSGMILHFNGDKWSLHHQLGTDTPLLAITGFGAHDVLVVGDEGRILRFDGVEWKRVDCGVNIELYGVWGVDSNHILAVGGAGELFRWNGEQWHNFNAGTDYSLYGIAGSGLNDIYFAGLSGTLIHFNGESFHRHNLGLRCDLHAVSRINGGQVFALGSLGTIMRLEDDAWHQETHQYGNVGFKAFTETDTKLVLVGEDGVVLVRDK